jgi:hypothetical protein
MADLEFYNPNTGANYLYDIDGEAYVVSQYKKWAVRVISDTTIIPKIRIGDRFVPLYQFKDKQVFMLPEDLKNEWNFTAQAGLLTLYAEINRPLKPSIYISPALAEREFGAILDRLGQLAIAHKNGLLCPVTVLSLNAEEQQRGEKSVQNMSRVEGFLHFARVIDSNWQAIQKAPSKEIKFIPKIVDLSNPVSLKSKLTIYHACRRPDKRRHEVQEPQENYNTLENQFLAYVIKEVIVRESTSIAEWFRFRAKMFRSIMSVPTRSHGHNYLQLWKDRSVAVEKEVDRLEKLADTIEKHAQRGVGYLRASFLANSQAKHITDTLPLAKIAQSISYGPVYKAYQEYRSNQVSTSFSSRLGLEWALEEKAIKPVPELFEIWAFIEVYAMLLTSFGFQSKGDSPLDLVTLDEGELNLPKGKKFHLYFSPKNMTGTAITCEIELIYNPKLQPDKCQYGKSCYTNRCKQLNLTCYKELHESKNWTEELNPDIVMIIKSPRGTKRIVLDAKYRNYAAQSGYERDKQVKFGVNNCFELDLFGTAKMKYLDALGFDASFILHSDRNPIYTVFGSEPFDSTPERELKLNESYNPAHRIGAIYMSPSNLNNLEKLLRCILMYHSGIEEICWPCQNQLTVENGGLTKHEGYKGDYYQCTDCGRFWIGTHCGNNSLHRLIKLGSESFHKTIKGNDWLCICPKCGIYFFPKRDIINASGIEINFDCILGNPPRFRTGAQRVVQRS